MPRHKVAALAINFALLVTVGVAGAIMYIERRQHDTDQDKQLEALQNQVNLNVNGLEEINSSLEQKLRVEPAEVQQTVRDGINEILSRLPEPN